MDAIIWMGILAPAVAIVVSAYLVWSAIRYTRELESEGRHGSDDPAHPGPTGWGPDPEAWKKDREEWKPEEGWDPDAESWDPDPDG